ncbi:MAG: hypothetical protein K6F15_09770 [Treponema sp.]|nr:hypothetical protein [Treponema sp.]
MIKFLFQRVFLLFAGIVFAFSLFSCGGSSGSDSSALMLLSSTSSSSSSSSSNSSSSSSGSSSSSSGSSSSGSSSSGSSSGTSTSSSVVLLQGFNWSANFHDRYYGDSDSSTYVQGTSDSSAPSGSKDWYDVITANADKIKNTFTYVWFPPASDSGSDNGYMPRMLNVLTSYYGNATNLASAISALSPAKAICDIVINHRVGTSNWGTFTNPSFCADYYAICSDDEGFSNSSSDMYGSSNKGNADTGEGYSSARDLDHTNWDVQNGLVSWMTNYLKAAGFVGWRYDYVKGFGGKYVGYYNAQTSAEFSVGEYWPTNGFSSSAPSAWSTELEAWVNATGSTSDTIDGRTYTPSASRVFDFVTKGMMNTVFGSNSSGLTNSNYNLLASEYCGYNKMPDKVVTFVDNHDTGSTQALWYLDPDDVGTAYALILTHPGVPCVAWQHYFTAEESYDTTISGNTSQYIGGNTVPGTSLTYRNFISGLISLRSEMGITSSSTITVWDETSSSMYLAAVSGTKGSLVVNLGSTYDMSSNSDSSSYTLAYSGTNFNIWKKSN